MRVRRFERGSWIAGRTVADRAARARGTRGPRPSRTGGARRSRARGLPLAPSRDLALVAPALRRASISDPAPSSREAQEASRATRRPRPPRVARFCRSRRHPSRRKRLSRAHDDAQGERPRVAAAVHHGLAAAPVPAQAQARQGGGRRRRRCVPPRASARCPPHRPPSVRPFLSDSATVRGNLSYPSPVFGRQAEVTSPGSPATRRAIARRAPRLARPPPPPSTPAIRRRARPPKSATRAGGPSPGGVDHSESVSNASQLSTGVLFPHDAPFPRRFFPPIQVPPSSRSSRLRRRTPRPPASHPLPPSPQINTSLLNNPLSTHRRPRRRR